MVEMESTSATIPVGLKQTEVGVIPEDWEIKRLGDLLSVMHGKSQKEVTDNSGSYPILGTGGFMGWANQYLHNKPCVLIGRKGSIDKPRYMDTPFWSVDTLFYCVVKDANDAKFLYYKFLQINWYDYNEASGVPSLNSRTIEKISIGVPNHNEQRRIAEVLTSSDSQIQALELLISKKRDIKQGTMQELLTGKNRLPGFSEEWHTYFLDDICNHVTTGKLNANAMINNGKYRFYTCARDFFYINDYAFDTEALLISGNGANVGYIHYYHGKFNAYQRTYVLHDFLCSIKYLHHYLADKLSERISSEVNAGNTPYITMSTLTEMQVVIPPTIEEQEAIAEILSDMDTEIAVLEKRLEKARAIKKGMMQQLLTGRIRLVDSSTPQEARV